LLKTTTNQEEVIHPWLDDDWGQRVIQQKISKEYITNENDALLKYPANFQGGYAVVNQNATNAWGYPRGYAIHPGYNAIHNVSLILFSFAAFAGQSQAECPHDPYLDRSRFQASAEQRELGAV
jgi:hypothetical protein